MNKDAKTQLTREKLLIATEKLIDKSEDPLKVSSRQIAQESGMQAAMINYCFGSREELIYTVFENKYNKALNEAQVQVILTDNTLTPKLKLKKLHYIIAKCLLDEYKLTRAITSLVLYKRDLSKESFSFKYVKEHYQNRKSDSECKAIAYELSTMMQLIIYRAEDFKNDFGINLFDETQLHRFIDMRFDLLLQD